MEKKNSGIAKGRKGRINQDRKRQNIRYKGNGNAYHNNRYIHQVPGIKYFKFDKSRMFLHPLIGTVEKENRNRLKHQIARVNKPRDGWRW